MIKVNQEQEEAFARAKATSDDFKLTFDTPHGTRVLEGMMRGAHVCPGSATFNPDEAAFREGQRSVINSILINLDISPNRQRMLMRSAMEIEQL